MSDQETNTQAPPPPDVKQLKCKRAMCRTPRLGVKKYSLPDGSMKMSLCTNCKATPFGSNFVEVNESVIALAKAAKQQNADQRARMTSSSTVDKSTGEHTGEALGQCQYPSCKEVDCKTWMTKSPHPITGVYKGRYCTFHKDLLNSRSRVLPHRIEKASGHIAYYLMTVRPIKASDITKQFGLGQETALDLIDALAFVLKCTVTRAECRTPDDQPDFEVTVVKPDNGSMTEQVTTVAERIETPPNILAQAGKLEA